MSTVNQSGAKLSFECSVEGIRTRKAVFAFDSRYHFVSKASYLLLFVSSVWYHGGKEILSPSTWHQHIVAISLYCITYGGEVKKLFLDINLRGHQINPPVYAMVIELLMPSPQE
jgi:hypothetical protein